MTEQLGLVTMYPPDCLRQLWRSSSAKWSPLTSGITSGTVASMRNALELLTTAHPAAANCGSNSRAMLASSAAKITLGAPLGVAGETTMSRTRAGIGVFRRQRVASP